MRQVLNKKIINLFVIAIIFLGLMSFAIVLAIGIFDIFPQVTSSQVAVIDRTAFPDIDESHLSDDQKKVVSILRSEYDSNPEGTKYSEGVNEAWCADFVSWVFNQAGRPFKNPHSGSWRIPGTFTLREYYESIGKLKLAETRYSPKVGDIMLYDNPSPFGQHVNIVIENDDGVITTIGGNEFGEIRVVKHATKDGAGFIGYGVF